MERISCGPSTGPELPPPNLPILPRGLPPPNGIQTSHVLSADETFGVVDSAGRVQGQAFAGLLSHPHPPVRGPGDDGGDQGVSPLVFDHAHTPMLVDGGHGEGRA